MAEGREEEVLKRGESYEGIAEEVLEGVEGRKGVGEFLVRGRKQGGKGNNGEWGYREGRTESWE